MLVGLRNPEKGAVSHIWGDSGHRRELKESKHKLILTVLAGRGNHEKNDQEVRSTWESTQTRELEFSQGSGCQVSLLGIKISI